MLKLEKSLRAWGSPEFEAVLKQELSQNAGELPLQQALALSSSVADTPITAVIHQLWESPSSIFVKTGIFYQGLAGGCSCADDPTLDSENTEYCILILEMDRKSAVAAVKLVPD